MKRRGFLLGAIAAPLAIPMIPTGALAVDLAPAVEAESAIALPTTIQMMTKEFLRLLAVSGRVGNGGDRVQKHIDIHLGASDFRSLSFQEISDRYIRPAAESILIATRGRPLSANVLPIPKGAADDGFSTSYNGIAVRGLAVYDIMMDAFVYRFDIRHS